MLNVETTERGMLNKLEFKGNVPEIASDVCIVIRAVYEGIAEKSNDNADIFKDLLTDAFAKGVVFDDEKLIAEARKSLVNELKNDETVKDLLKAIKEMLDED